MGMRIDSETGVYHYSTDSGFKIDLVTEGAMDALSAIKEKKIQELNIEVDKQGHKAMEAETMLMLEKGLVATLQKKVKDLENWKRSAYPIVYNTMWVDDCPKDLIDKCFKLTQKKPLSPETKSSIERGLEDVKQGRVKPFEDVEKEGG